jgi:hypothetical protein
VFRTVLGVWLQTNPTAEERKRCLSCHVPATTVFPQHAEKITAQILSGQSQIEGIGCASCHLIKSVETTMGPPPTFKIEPGKTMHGPYADPEENLVHPAVQSPLFRGANYCASCHFDKVKDVTQNGAVDGEFDFEAGRHDALDRAPLFPGRGDPRHPAQEPQPPGRVDAAHRHRQHEIRRQG